MKVTASPVQTGSQFTATGEVVGIEYALGSLQIKVEELGGGRYLWVRFEDVQGFRVLDERDLMEYWPTCSTPNGWLFQVQSGGWLSQESVRPGSLIGSLARVGEYLVAGTDDCVNVLAFDPPVVSAWQHGGGA